MNNQIEQIRAEIERRNLANYCGTAEQYEEELFAILDTIEAAKPTCKNCRHYENDCPQIRGMFAPYPSRVCKDDSDTTAQARPVPADVQEAADKAAKKYASDTFINECMENGACDANDLEYAFKAGIAYERERMMKEAVKGEIVKDISGKLGVTAKANLDGFKFGEKVNVIIIKKEK